MFSVFIGLLSQMEFIFVHKRLHDLKGASICFKKLRLLTHIVITYKISFARSSLEDKSEEQNVFQSDKRTSNNSSSSTKHGDLLSAMLLARVDRRDSDGGDSDDVPPPLPTTSPPKLSPDSTLTWDHKERMQLKLGNFHP